MSHLGTRKGFGKQMFLHLGQMFYDNSALIAVATRTYFNWKMLWYFTRGKKRKKVPSFKRTYEDRCSHYCIIGIMSERAL